MIDPRNNRLTAFDWLAKRIEHMRRELRELVEKEDAMMGKRDLSRFRPDSPAHKGCHARGMMGRTERPVRSERAVYYHARDALDHRDLKQFLRLKRRQDAWKTLGQHRLSRAGRADHEHVMPACSRDLQSSLGALLAAHVLEVGSRFRALIEMRLRLRNKHRSLQVIDESHEMRRRYDWHRG